MLGDGLSRAHMQAILDFTHDMGGKKAALLPKKINGCWKALTKVFALLNVNVTFHVTLRLPNVTISLTKKLRHTKPCQDL